MIALSESALHPPVGGRRLLLALAGGVGSAAFLGFVTYFLLRPVAGRANHDLLIQIIVLETYLILISALRIAFGPFGNDPIALKFSLWRDVWLASLTWLVTLAVIAACYVVIAPAFGGFARTFNLIISNGTDARRLQSQSLSSWCVALVRGCLVVPIFEEIFFRGVLLQWLKRYFRRYVAVVVMAALFAVMHVYPALLLYAFLFGLTTGWIREKTGSTFNTVVMHVLNNITLLVIGLRFLR